MPFTVRCPHCKRYMLIEDELRGAAGKCLVCSQAIRFEPTAAAAPGLQTAQSPTAPSQTVPSQTPPPATPSHPQSFQAPTAGAPAIAAAPAGEVDVRQCPNPVCGARMRVPAAARGKRVTCPKCRQAFV